MELECYWRSVVMFFVNIKVLKQCCGNTLISFKCGYIGNVRGDKRNKMKYTVEMMKIIQLCTLIITGIYMFCKCYMVLIGVDDIQNCIMQHNKREYKYK